MPEARTCSECGTPLSNDAPEGFCPTCMLEGALRLGSLVTKPDPHPASGHALPSDGSGAGGEGTHFGDYELLDEIARGGMGVVYRARQISLDRIVAVKLILIGQFANKATVRRFKAEAAAAAKLRHPNIVAIHEIGEEAGQHFFSMDYVEGANLADFIRQQPISIRQTAQLLKTIAEALHYAHEQGIVHRDLKPSNILIDGLLEPRITDFGLAKDLKADSDLTLTGQMLGSPNYISPEQASGKVAVGVPTDIYSLGAILYHLLSGRPPFAAETVTSTLQQVANEEPVSPRLLNPSVPRDLETICLRCLEKEPERRYPSAKILAEELNRFLHDEPIQARPVGPLARTWRWCRRKPAVAGLIAAVVLSIVLGLSGVLWQWRQSEAHRHLAEQKADESRRNLYAADMILAQGALEAGNIGRAEELLRKYLPQAGEKDLRGWEWRYAWGQCRSDELFTLKGHAMMVTTLALSTNGGVLASGSMDRTVVLWDLENKKPIRTLAQSDSVYGLAFSKDDKELIVGTADGQVTFWNCETWQPVATLSNLSWVRFLTVSPDGKLLAVFGKHVLTLWNLRDRQEIARFGLLRSNDLIPGGVAFSPDSSVLAYSKGDGRIVLWDLANAKTIAELGGHERYVSSLAFSPDGSILVSGSRDRTVRVWDLSSRKELRRLANFSGWVGGMAFSPDGGLLAVVGAGQRVRLFETRSWNEINSLKGHSEEIWTMVLAPDGRTIMTGSKDRMVKCWAVSTNQQPALQRLPSDVNAAFLLPDAKHLYLTHTNGTSSMWRTDPLEETERYRLQILDTMASTVSPDGTLWAGATTNGIVQVVDHIRGRVVAGLPSSRSSTYRFRYAFSPDSQMLAGVGNDHTCRVWRISPRATPNSDDGGLQEIAAFGIGARSVWALKFLHNGRLLGIGGWEGVTEIWNIVTMQKVATLRGHNWSVSDIVMSRDETIIVTASGDGKVKVWDLRSGREIASLGGQLVSFFSVAFSPDESRLAACGGDGIVRLWDMQTKQEVASLKIHNYPLSRLAFSTDDDSLVVLGSGGGPLFVLRAPKDSERPVVRNEGR